MFHTSLMLIQSVLHMTALDLALPNLTNAKRTYIYIAQTKGKDSLLGEDEEEEAPGRVSNIYLCLIYIFIQKEKEKKRKEKKGQASFSETRVYFLLTLSSEDVFSKTKSWGRTSPKSKWLPKALRRKMGIKPYLLTHLSYWIKALSKCPCFGYCGLLCVTNGMEFL